MKTLYLTDLDGTLLRSDASLSEYTASIINHFIKNNGCFSYATARSFITASKVTEKLDTEFPVICYNGAFILENKTKEVLSANYLTADEIKFVSEVLNANNIYPIVYSRRNGMERFSYIEQRITPATKNFLSSRAGDPRHHKVETVKELYSGDIFYFACIGTEQSLAPINEVFSTDIHLNCIYQKDVYSGDQWCELLSSEATKANAAMHLKAMLDCDKLIVFGDGRNDLSLFSVADESFAVKNAVPELKKVATGVIDSNDNDGVAKWIKDNAL